MIRPLYLLLITLLVLPLAAQSTDDLPQPPEIAVLGRGTADTLDWHPDGAVLAVGGARGLWFYDDTLADLAYFDTPGLVRYVVWSPTGDQLVTVDDNRDLNLWDVQLAPYTLTHVQSWTFEQPDDSYRFARPFWSPSGDRIAVLTPDQGAQILDVATGERRLTIPDAQSTLAWHPDGTQIAGAVDLGEAVGSQVRVWDATTGEEVATYLGVDNYLFWGDLLWSIDGDMLVGGTSVPSTLHVWDVETKGLLNESEVLLGEFNAIGGMWWSDDSQNLITVERSASGPNVTTTARDIDTWAESESYSVRDDRWYFAKQPGHDQWATINSANSITIYALGADVPQHTNTSHTPIYETLAWSTGDQLAATDNYSGRIQVWDEVDTSTPTVQDMRDPFTRFQTVNVRWDDDILLGFINNIPATSVYTSIQAWRPSTGEYLGLRTEFAGDWNPLYAWNNDFTRVAERNYNRQGVTISTVDERDNDAFWPGEAIVNIAVPEVRQLYWSPDDTTLAIVSGPFDGPTTVELYTAETGDLLSEVFTHDYGSVQTINWQPDGIALTIAWREYVPGRMETRYWLDVVAINGVDGTATPITQIPTAVEGTIYSTWHGDLLAVAASGAVDVYHINDTDEPITTIPDAELRSLAWRGDGTWLAGAHVDGTIRVWDVRGIEP